MIITRLILQQELERSHEDFSNAGWRFVRDPVAMVIESFALCAMIYLVLIGMRKINHVSDAVAPIFTGTQVRVLVIS